MYYSLFQLSPNQGFPVVGAKKKQPSVGQRKANKISWRKNINKTNGNFFRKKKSSPKKNSQRRQLRDSPTSTELANSPYTLLH